MREGKLKNIRLKSNPCAGPVRREYSPRVTAAVYKQWLTIVPHRDSFDFEERSKAVNPIAEPPLSAHGENWDGITNALSGRPEPRQD